MRQAAARLGGKLSAKAAAKQIAEQVVRELLTVIQGDPLEQALSMIDRAVLQSPVTRLAGCEEINTAGDFLKLRIARLEAEHGKFHTQHEQERERHAVCAALTSLLARRYERHLSRP